jgi:hypothetical protein
MSFGPVATGLARWRLARQEFAGQDFSRGEWLRVVRRVHSLRNRDRADTD